MPNFCLVTATLCFLMSLGYSRSSGEEIQDASRAEIRQMGTEYVEAFNAHDAKSIAAFWSPEAVYTNRSTGEQVVGREAITEQFDDLFETSGDLKISIDLTSIDFVSPNVAVENGTASFVSPEAEPQLVPYTAVYVRREGKWLLDRVTDKPELDVPSRLEELKDLQWMVGSWADESDSAQVVTECRWTKNQTFLTRSFSVSIDGRVDLSGMQFIGWDPMMKQIRSWTFDSDGGYATGRWSRSGDKWYVSKNGTTADGEAVTALNVLTKVDGDTFTLTSTRRTLAGNLLPNVEEIIVVRQ